jgi:hypothetical protein
MKPYKRTLNADEAMGAPEGGGALGVVGAAGDEALWANAAAGKRTVSASAEANETLRWIKGCLRERKRTKRKRLKSASSAFGRDCRASPEPALTTSRARLQRSRRPLLLSKTANPSNSGVALTEER